MRRPRSAHAAGIKKPQRMLRFLCESANALICRLQRADVRGLQALLALLHFELDALVFDQGLEARALNVAEVCEQVSAARVLSDEAVALAFVEPFHGTGLGRHFRNPI